MRLLRNYGKTPFFLFINITGLAIGLAASIMLVLFIVNELSYDRHFPDYERIFALTTVWEEEDMTEKDPITTRTAYTEIPAKVPGVETAVQIYRGNMSDIRHNTNTVRGELFFADNEFFDVFRMRFIEGTRSGALGSLSSAVLTEPVATALFGTAAEAVGQSVTVWEKEYFVSAVVEPLPSNTHFTVDIIVPMENFEYLTIADGLEYHVFYVAEKNASMAEVRNSVETAYTEILRPFADDFGARAYGVTVLLKDIYLSPDMDWTLGKKGSIAFIWLLSGIAVFILLFAVSNFVNLFVAQGETRMNEIGVRKAVGAETRDIVRQIFTEVSVIVLAAFAAGGILAVLLAPPRPGK